MLITVAMKFLLIFKLSLKSACKSTSMFKVCSLLRCVCVVLGWNSLCVGGSSYSRNNQAYYITARPIRYFATKIV